MKAWILTHLLNAVVSNEGFGDEAGKPRNPKLLAEITSLDLRIGFATKF